MIMIDLVFFSFVLLSLWYKDLLIKGMKGCKSFKAFFNMFFNLFIVLFFILENLMN